MKNVKKRLALFMCVCLLFSSIPSNCFAENLISENIEENIVVLEDNISSESEIELSEDNEEADDFEEIVSDVESIEENLDAVNNIEEEPEEDFASDEVKLEEKNIENENIDIIECDTKIASESELDVDENNDDVENILKNEDELLDENSENEIKVKELKTKSNKFNAGLFSNGYQPKTYTLDDFITSKLSSATKITIQKGGNIPSGNPVNILSTYSEAGLYQSGSEYVVYAEIDDTIKLGSGKKFQMLTSLKEIHGLGNLDTSETTSLSKMFYFCMLLESIDFEGFDTSNIEDMSCMFECCASLIELDLSSFDTRNVNNMGGMFRVCANLKTVYVDENKFVIPNNSNEMFDGCNELTGEINGKLSRVPNDDEIIVEFVTDVKISSSVTMMLDAAVDKQYVAKGGKIAIPLESQLQNRWGNIVVGWYKDQAYTEEWNFDDPVYDNMVLYARWGKNFVINTEGGKWTPSTPSTLSISDSAGNIVLPIRGVTLDRYDSESIGWKWYAENTVEQILTGDVVSLQSFIKEIYPIWKNKTFTNVVDNTTTTTTSEKTTYSSSSSDSSGDGGSGSGPLKASTLTQGQQPLKQPTPVKQVQVNNSSKTAPVVQSQNATWSLDPVTNTFKLEIKDASGNSVKVQNGFCKLANVEKQIINNQVVDVPVESLYCFDANGDMCTGWVQTADKGWYYFDTDQATFGQGAKNSWKEVDGKFYYFDNDGKMLSNTITPDGKQVNENGELVTAYNDATPAI